MTNRVTIEELEKTHDQVPIIQVKAEKYREGRDAKYILDDNKESFFSMPDVGDKLNCYFESAKFITHVAIAFRKGNERQYSFRISSKDFMSNKQSEEFEVFDIEDFTGKNMEIISRGYHENDINGSSFSAYQIRAYTPKDAPQPKTTQFKTTLETKTDIEGISAEPINVEGVTSLEFDPNPENSIAEKESFESTGRGRVLRHDFAEVYKITAIEFISNLPEGKQQLIRINSQDMQTLKPGETARYELEPFVVGKSIDLILNGNTVDEKNSIGGIKYYGYPLRLEDELAQKKKLEEEQKTEEIKTNISQED